MNRSLLLRTAASTLLALNAAKAGVEEAPVVADPAGLTTTSESFADWLWGLPILIDDPNAGFIQKLAITGRYHGQAWFVDSDQGEGSDWENRRLWVGADMTFLKKFRVKADVVLDAENWDPAYSNLYEAYASYKHNDAFTFNFGRREPILTQEFHSSKTILTLERSLLVNTLHPENIAGWWANGSFGDGWQYDLGLYSGTLDKELGSFDAGWVYMASLGYDFAKLAGTGKSLLRLDYLGNDGDAGNNQAKPYEHSVSLNYTGEYGKFGMITDVMFGSGLDSTSDVWGLVLMPTYNISEKLQLVGRYQFANSEDPNGLNLQRRYERQADALPGTRGDQYQAFYAGINYYIHQHKLKVMTGIEYSMMDDAANDGGEFDGWSGFAGLRLYF